MTFISSNPLHSIKLLNLTFNCFSQRTRSCKSADTVICSSVTLMSTHAEQKRTAAARWTPVCDVPMMSSKRLSTVMGKRKIKSHEKKKKNHGFPTVAVGFDDCCVFWRKEEGALGLSCDQSPCSHWKGQRRNYTHKRKSGDSGTEKSVLLVALWHTSAGRGRRSKRTELEEALVRPETMETFFCSEGREGLR